MILRMYSHETLRRNERLVILMSVYHYECEEEAYSSAIVRYKNVVL